MKHLAFLLFASCAVLSAPATPQSETKEQGWARARVIEATVNGCAVSCPSTDGGLCVDSYGLCWSACAWLRVDAAGKDILRRVALETDPTRSFLVACPPPPPGAVETSWR